MRLSAVLLSVWMGVRGCGWSSSSSVLHMGTSVFALENNALSSASTADEIMLRIIVDRLRAALLLGGFSLSFDRKWWNHARLCALFLYR